VRRHAFTEDAQHADRRKRARASATTPAGVLLPLQRAVGNRAVAGVLQRDWVCPDCDATGPGKPKAKCPECGNKNLQEVKEKATFGVWWAGLSEARKQELLRAHGTHEARGGGQQRDKGGGTKKGDQHDTGVATAKQAIRREYDAGMYD
jgi:hypothetical protein